MIASPTWWLQTSMPIRSYLESPAAWEILDGKPFATVSVSRRYYGANLRQQRKLAEKNGGQFTDKTHFVAAGGQVKSMLSWLGYMKHGEPQQRVWGLRMPAPNLQPDFEEQAKTFADGLLTKSCSQLPRLPTKGALNESAGRESPTEHPAGDDRSVAPSTGV